MADVTEKPVDMSYTKSELKDRNVGYPVATSSKSDKGPKYPWGLTLRLDNVSLKKLGMDGDLPEVGELCQVSGVGRIISVSMRENPDGATKDVEIQIERLNLAVDESGEDESAEADNAFEAGAKKGRGRAGY